MKINPQIFEIKAQIAIYYSSWDLYLKNKNKLFKY